MRKLLCLLLVVGCSSPPPATTETAVDSAEMERILAQDPQYSAAKLFDELIQNRLTADQRLTLEDECRTTPESSPFCFSILNRERFIERVKQRDRESVASKTRSRTIRPRFNRANGLLNWAEIKDAPIAGLLRGLPRRHRAKMNALKLAALRESDCPNTAAVAIAAVLEDQLPSRVTFDELGRLYEKGGACMGATPADQEPVLTRAGLLYYAKGDYALAKEVLEKASAPEGVFTGRALYWLYRTLTKLGEDRAARRTLDRLQTKYPFSFHSLIAQTGAGRDPGELLSRSSSSAVKRSRQDPEVNQLLEQVEILIRLGFDASAGTVLDWAVAISKGLEPEVMLYIAELKKGQGDYKSKIMILSDVLYQNPSMISRQTLELYFPKVFFPIFEKHSSVIDPYFLLAIARRESAFDAKAVSSANARGLLQLLPRTARRLKKRPNLFDPETNIAVGAKYFVSLLKRTDGSVHLALAAYNAGPNKLKSWTKNYPTDDPILFTDLIPFRETREYVGSVLRNYYWYRRIHASDQPIPQDKLLEIAHADEE